VLVWNHLGVQLLRRTTRSLKPTAEGSRYLERIRVILSEIDELVSLRKR